MVVLTPDEFTTVTPIPPGLEAPVAPLTRLRFATRDIQPPAGLWVTPDDFLVAGVANALAGVQLQVQGRMILPDGSIALPGFTVTPAGDRLLRYSSVQLYYGFLVAVAVWAVGSTLPQGTQTFASLQLVRPPISGFNLDWPMASGYVTANTFLATPYGAQAPAQGVVGQLYRVTGTAPAAGAEWFVTVPTNARWKVRMIWSNLTTSNQVANRVPGVQITDGANSFGSIEAQATVPANSAQGAIFFPGGPAGVSEGSWINAPFPIDLELAPGWKIGSSTIGLQSNDQYAAPILHVEEVIVS